MNWRHRPPRSTPKVFRFLFGTVHPPRDWLSRPSLVTTCLRTLTERLPRTPVGVILLFPEGPWCASPRKQSLSCPQRCSRSSPSPMLLMDKQSPPSRQRSKLRDLPLHNPPTTPSSSWPLATIPIGASASD